MSMRHTATDANRGDECTLCVEDAPHHVFITAPPGWGSIMPCSQNTRQQGVVVRSDEESAQLRAERVPHSDVPRRSGVEYAVSAASGELRVYATKEWAEKAVGEDTGRLLSRTVTDGHHGPWKPHRELEEAHEGMVTIPRPHVPHGPQGTPEDVADANYLREAAQKLETHYKPFGSNLRATVVQLLRDAADAVADEREQGT